MSYTGINLENVKNNNRSAILKLLNDQGAMSRKDIASALGLTPATVSVICAELLSLNILCDLGELKEERRAGRKKMLLAINYDRYYVLSVSVESIETVITVSNLRGERAVSHRVKTDTSVSPEEFFRRIANEGKALLWENGIDRISVLGVGVSIPGIVLREEGISTATYRLWEHPVNIRACLQAHLEYPVVVENNVKAFAEAEMIYGSGKEQENLLFLKWGPGVGSSIVIHKQIYESRKFKSAEIGHVIIDRNGKQCRCGRRGCLETLTATHALAEYVRERFNRKSMPQLWALTEGDPERIQARNIREWIDCNDSALWTVLEENINLLAQVVSNTMTMLSPDRTIIYGNMFSIPKLRECFMRCCAQYDPSYNEEYITLSRLSDQIEYIGPLAVVVSEIFLSGRI
ncbi:MAG: ROK family transcriptional regulator [Oscillospiraceae bacterium]|nr:ROK family transcriptional regulator [Oscillospiraceae bacterium]